MYLKFYPFKVIRKYFKLFFFLWLKKTKRGGGRNHLLGKYQYLRPSCLINGLYILEQIYLLNLYKLFFRIVDWSEWMKRNQTGPEIKVTDDLKTNYSRKFQKNNIFLVCYMFKKLYSIIPKSKHKSSKWSRGKLIDIFI